NLLIDVQGGDVNNGQATIPRDGTYYVRVQPWNGDYNTEYRFRVTLAPPGSGQMETEANDQFSQADGLSFTLAGNQLSNRIYGLLDTDDGPGDYFGLGNIAAGTEVAAALDLPTSTTLTSYTLQLYRSSNAGTPVATSTDGPLTHLLQPGDEDTYYLRLTGTGLGMLAEYFINTSLTDTTPPTITSVSLPAEGVTLDFFGRSFSIGYSEDMLPETVNEPANFELLGSGGDGTFDDGNELIYALAPASYASGLSQGFTITDGPLLADDYRFTVTTNLRDKLNNNLAAPYVRTFSITDVAGYVSEDRDNDSFASADSLSLAPDLGAFDSSFVNSGISQSSAGSDPRDIVSADF
ncbi:Ig-like domain-containing protein, partial [Haloferula sargassicola]|uniref:Ig-like domain-containing protein n=1 Tax=Haloferula sargassicola TaxID=490096 RepID=UPI0033657E7D